MRKQNINFRSEEVSYISDRWIAFEPISLIGVGSVGKSNLLHHLSDENTHDHYLGESAIGFATVIIDPFLLGSLPDKSENVEQYKLWAGIELIMHRLYMTFHSSDLLDDPDRQKLFELYETLQNGNNPLFTYLGIRYFELSLKLLFDRNIQLVLMFDEFEEFLRLMPYKFFQTLRGLRDNYKTQFTFLTFTRSPIPALVQEIQLDYMAMEPFLELFNDNILYIGPYNDQDAMSMLKTLTKRNPQSIFPDHIYQLILYSSGKFAGLLRAIFRVVKTLGEIEAHEIYDKSLMQKLASYTPVRTECKTIWLSLSDVEKQVLHTIAKITSYRDTHEFDEAVKLLLKKQLLSLDRKTETLKIKPPVFEYFVQNYSNID